MLETLTKSQQTELRDVAAYIGKLPPLEEWVKIRQTLDPKAAVFIHSHWEWLGKSLDAYFSDTSDPVPDSSLPESWQKIVQENSNKFIIYSALIFQGERFVKREAKVVGIDYPFKKRSDLLKTIALEECQYDVLLSLQKHWESHSEAQRNERLRDSQKYAKGEMSEGLYEKRLKHWEEEDEKLYRDKFLALRAMPWRHFCMYVFQKYKRQLPAFEALVDTLGVPKGKHGKFSIVNGSTKAYPGRGKNKR